RVGAHETLLRLADDELVAAAEHAHGLALDEAHAALVVGNRFQSALGLGDDLLGDDHDVVFAQVDGRDDEIGDLVARADLGHPFDGQDGDHASSTTRAKAVASARPCMTVGATTQRTPSAPTAAARSASASSTTSVPANGAYKRATPTTVGSRPSSAMSRSAAHEVVLEGDLAFALDVGPGLHPVVAHREDTQPEAPRLRQLVGHLAQRGALAEAMRPVQVGGQVAVAQAEPRESSVPLERF